VVAAVVLLVLVFFLRVLHKDVCAPGSLCPEPNAREGRRSHRGLITGSRQRTVKAEEAGTVKTMTLTIEGMTCAAYTVVVQRALSAVLGLKDVSIPYPEGQATITMDVASPSAHEPLKEAIERVG
jgi:copper chaperone CopZ